MRVFIALLALSVMLVLVALPTVWGQTPEVYIEALGTANLRSGAGQDYAVVGEISAGTEYRVLKQHALVPWLLIEVPSLPTGGGWVFKDLVQLKRGSLSAVPVEEGFTELTGTGITAPPVNPAATPDSSISTGSSVPTLATAAPANLVTARLTGRSNIRYAPGTDYPTILMLDEGAILIILARHSGLPWYQVAVEGSPTGTGWVNEGVVEVKGDIYTLPVISETAFDFPTPSATPNTIVVSTPPVTGFSSDGVTLASNLGQTIDNYLLSQGVAPRTDREGSVFVLDLASGEHFTLNGNVAYSGMSINKIPVLVSYFLHRNEPLNTSDAELVASMMICSENTSTNRVMTEVGAGDILAGGQQVTSYMKQLGLGNTFVVAPFSTGDTNATPAPVSSIQTQVDQQRTQPDLFNQLTIEEIGWLLGSVYNCAANYTGPLVETFPNQITQLECQQMIRVMSGNKIGRLIEAGTAPNTTIAHKHGWINNTHGDAGIVFGPQGAYVIGMVYFQRGEWLEYDQSFPVLEEVARLTWNYFNPSYGVSSSTTSVISEECNIYGETVIPDMLGGNIAIPTIPAAEIATTPTLEVAPTSTPIPTLTPTAVSFVPVPQTTEEVNP